MNEETIKNMVRQCMKHLQKPKYELGINKKHIDNAVNITEVFSRKKGRSRGGKFKIKINLACWQVVKNKTTWSEYKSFNSDPHIGEVFAPTDREKYWCLVAHEVSHHVQHKICPNFNRFLGKWEKPHGEVFKTIYRYLRKDFINPMLSKNNIDSNKKVKNNQPQHHKGTKTMEIDKKLFNRITLAAQAEIYNFFVSEDKQIKKFSDKKVAADRLADVFLNATAEQLAEFRKKAPIFAHDLGIFIPPEIKHFNLRCVKDNYMLKTNQLCLEWARPQCPVCGSMMLTFKERKEGGL